MTLTIDILLRAEIARLMALGLTRETAVGLVAERLGVNPAKVWRYAS